MRSSHATLLAAAIAGAALAVVDVSTHARAAAPAAPAAGAATTYAPPLFTEDFEGENLKKDVWDVRIGGAGGGGGGRAGRGAAPAASAPAASAPANANASTVTIVHDQAAHGKSSLLVHTPQGSRAYSFITAAHLPDSLKNHFFGRAYVNFPKAPPNAHDVFITAGSAGFPTSNFMEIGLRQNKAQLSYQQNGAGVARGETMIAGPAYPINKWFCLEWEFNDSPDNITIWIDGEKVTDKGVGFQGTSTNLIKGFTEFSFGFRSWGNVTAPFDVYYDDIAFGTSRIGPIKDDKK